MPCTIQARLDFPAYMRPENMSMSSRMILQCVLDEIGTVVDLNQGMGRVTAYPETAGKGKMGLLPIMNSVKGASLQISDSPRQQM